MDGESNNSEAESDIFGYQNEKPNNKNKFTSKGITISSQFPGGNLKQVDFVGDSFYEGKLGLVIEFWSNSDTGSDVRDKAWFYFCVSGMKDSRNIKYSYILFRFKNANVYRKFLREKKHRPYIVSREMKDKGSLQWKPILLSKLIVNPPQFRQNLQNQVIQAEFAYKINPSVDKIQFALNIPYNMSNLDQFHTNILDHIETYRRSEVYYHRQVIAESADGHPVYMVTITSSSNISSYNTVESKLWPYNGQRPYLLKKKPQIVVTARVHPSQTSSSVCAEGLIENLIKKSQFCALAHLFIFRIIPMVNPDGVENGHYRLDNYFQNLNRFYGHSDSTKTPSVYAIQKLITNLRQNRQLFLFLDIHGHNSPKPSFIFGNFSHNFYHTLENKTFARVLEALSPDNFSFIESQFSKRNMSVKQKYDEHSKQASARVFAYQGNSSAEGTIANIKSDLFTEHSYTLQINPYIMDSKKKSEQNIAVSLPSIGSPQSKSTTDITQSAILSTFKEMGENVLIAIMEILGLNNFRKLQENQDSKLLRIRYCRELVRLPQYCDKNRKDKIKQINKEILQRYYQKWGIIDSFKQFIDASHQSERVKDSFRNTPIYQIYIERNNKYEERRKAESIRRSDQTNLNIFNRQKSNKKSQTGLSPDKEQLAMQQINIRRKSQNEQINGVLAYDDSTSELKKYSESQIKINSKLERNNSKQTYPIVVKRNTPVLSIDNSSELKLQDMEGYLQKKIRKLIFRHNTEIQTKDINKRGIKKLKLKAEFDYLENSLSREKLSQGQQQLRANVAINLNRLEPLSKKKSKVIRIKTDASKNGYDLNSLVWNSSKHEKKRDIGEFLKSRVISSENPKIKQILKRVSLENRTQSSMDEAKDNPIDLQRMKISKTMLSNLVMFKPNKIVKKSQDLPGISDGIASQMAVYDSNHSLISLVHQSETYDKIFGRQPSESRKFPGSYRSISPIPEQKNKIGQSEKNSMKRVKTEDVTFLEKVKDMIAERKRIYQSQEPS